MQRDPIGKREDQRLHNVPATIDEMRAMIRALADTAQITPRELVTHRGILDTPIEMLGLTANEVNAAHRLVHAYLAACENEGVDTYPDEAGWRG